MSPQPHAYEALIDQVLGILGKRIVMGLPLALGKPNRLVNAFYARACQDPSIQLEIVTALSLDLPEPDHWLQERFLKPFLNRHFGTDYPRLDYLADLRAESMPDNIRVTEFYFQSGAALGNRLRQRRYISSNYTHVARDLADRGVNLTLQLVSPPRNGVYSLSCNPDVSLDLKKRLERLNDRRHLTIGQVHPGLPFMPGDAVVEPDFFDHIIATDPVQPLFGLPRSPVSLQDQAVGFHASRLIADQGTLQIGIGSLADALVHSLILRQRDNTAYRELLAALEPPVCELEDRRPFEHGLYGASELFMDGFMHLYRAGILKREVFDDEQLQQRANAGEALDQAGTGAVMDGGFYLGSRAFYDFLNGLSETERPRFRMHGVGRINQLYGGNEALEIAQRLNARFVNTCMMVTATGAAVSDGLRDHQVVSGVGGQYNFIAMAHAMEGGRSILMLRATRDRQGQRVSNIVWDYPACTIPRHMRDIFVTEYGIADLRGKTDEECIQTLVGVMDAEFQEELVERARSAGKLACDWQIPAAARRNTPAFLHRHFDRQRFPAYPFGCDFTELELELIAALKQLRVLARSKPQLLAAAWRGRPARHRSALARLGLDQPGSLREKLYARLVAALLDPAG
ncbi:MAG: acetyl-CoA hydrolase/transferase C-terminal domain-containing protein [Wenzhouxiangella sp.]